MKVPAGPPFEGEQLARHHEYREADQGTNGHKQHVQRSRRLLKFVLFSHDVSHLINTGAPSVSPLGMQQTHGVPVGAFANETRREKGM